MKYTIRNRPKTTPIVSEVERWFEGFFLDTIPRLLKRIDNFKDSIPVDVANQIIREELLGE